MKFRKKSNICITCRAHTITQRVSPPSTPQKPQCLEQIQKMAGSSEGEARRGQGVGQPHKHSLQYRHFTAIVSLQCNLHCFVQYGIYFVALAPAHHHHLPTTSKEMKNICHYLYQLMWVMCTCVCTVQAHIQAKTLTMVMQQQQHNASKWSYRWSTYVYN